MSLGALLNALLPFSATDVVPREALLEARREPWVVDPAHGYHQRLGKVPVLAPEHIIVLLSGAPPKNNSNSSKIIYGLRQCRPRQMGVGLVVRRVAGLTGTLLTGCVAPA